MEGQHDTAKGDVPNATKVMRLNDVWRRSLAADRVEGWSDLKRDIKLENAWVFASEDAMAGSIKAFLDFEKKLLEPIPKAERANVKLTEISGAGLGPVRVRIAAQRLYKQCDVAA